MICTIGYSGFSLPDFLAVLVSHGVNVLVDVRSVPYSSHFPEYSRAALEGALKRNHILYRNYAREFGARQENPAWFSEEGYLDFEKFAASPQFHDGVTRILAGMKMGFCFALMCAEKDPVTCHRAILVSRAFSRLGFDICHLQPGGAEESQGDLEQRLLDLHFPDRSQASLFGSTEDEEELVRMAYRKQNAVIGFRMTSDHRS